MLAYVYLASNVHIHLGVCKELVKVGRGKNVYLNLLVFFS